MRAEGLNSEGHLHCPGIYIYIHIDAQVVKYYPKSNHHSIDVTIMSSGTYQHQTIFPSRA